MNSEDNCEIYHEKQVRELCALHALNNLFQTKGYFSKLELDTICHSLSPDVWINPHKSIFGLGNYDINVIMKALQDRGFEAIWFDKRKDPSCLNLDNICGFILNVPSDYKIGFVMLPLRRRHWVTLRQINGFFYNLDSKLDGPEIIGNSEDLLDYLKEQLDCKDKELFLVVESEVDKTQNWLLNKASYSNNVKDADVEVVQLKDIVSDGVNVTINPLCDKHEDFLDHW
ncbi:hypothetical protein FQR65_LT11675 [Abscondita terminalis]|nr:hypothetical protein FQR65_LT11675 [Abscondita terminalis]